MDVKISVWFVGLQLVTNEGIRGFSGTKYQIESGVRADFVIAGEPTNFDIAHEAKGILQVNFYTVKQLTALTLGKETMRSEKCMNFLGL